MPGLDCPGHRNLADSLLLHKRGGQLQLLSREPDAKTRRSANSPHTDPDAESHIQEQRKEMNDAHQSQLKEESLASSAAVAFIGALLLAQSWEPSGGVGVYELPFNLTIPVLHDAVYFAIAAFLFVSSFVLALASIVQPLRRWVLCTIRPFSTLLAFFVWVAFLASWAESTSKLPSDQWWSGVLFLGGFVFFLFLGYRIPRAAYQSRAD